MRWQHYFYFGGRKPDQPLHGTKPLALRRIDQRPRGAGSTSTTGSADAMHVALRFVRQLVVEYVGHTLDVYTTRCNICCYQHPGVSGLEPLQRPLACVLRLVAVHCLGTDTARLQLTRHSIGSVFGPGKYYSPGDLNTTQQVFKNVAFVLGVYHDHTLVGLLDGDLLWRHIYLYGVRENLTSKRSNFFRHGGREQE